MASDKLASIKLPLVTMDLDLQTGDSSRLVSVEMNKEELKSLISSLDAANKVRHWTDLYPTDYGYFTHLFLILYPFILNCIKNLREKAKFLIV